MKIEKLNVILEVTPSLTERQYINVLTIIKEGYEEELKKLKKKTAKELKKVRETSVEHKNDILGKRLFRREIIRTFNNDKLKLKLRYFPSFAKSMVKAKGKEAIKTLKKHKKGLAAAGITTAALGAAAVYKSKKRHDEAKKRLGIK